MTKNIAIIPARGGSQRIPHKNIKTFHGKPIIAYSIGTAKASGLFDRIYVSTDSSDIAEVAEYYGAEVVARPTCDGTAGTQDVTARTLMELPYSVRDSVCCIYATAPLMLVSDLVLGHQFCRPHGFAFAVGTEPLRDAGQFYWGKALSFISDEPLISPGSVMIPVDEKRVCDINTYDDWYEAVRKYEVLKNE